MTMAVQNGSEDLPLFEPQILEKIDASRFKGSYSKQITPQNLGGSLKLRPLRLSDYDKGFIELLSQLTRVGDISEEQFFARFNSMKSCAGTYYIVVVEDMNTKQIVATATLVMEEKFIHDAGVRGRIEDVVVSHEYRGKQLGKLLLDTLTVLGENLGCYKTSLECKTNIIPFYTQFGYVKDHDNNYLVQRFKD